MVLRKKVIWVFCFERKENSCEHTENVSSFLCLGALAHLSFKDDMAKGSFCLVVVSRDSRSTQTDEIFILVLSEALFQSFEFFRIFLVRLGKDSEFLPENMFLFSYLFLFPFSRIFVVSIFLIEKFPEFRITFSKCFICLFTESGFLIGKRW